MVQWTSVETGLTQAGVPDSEGAYRGAQWWIECKATSGWAVGLEVFQIGWHLRRAREGGTSFVAVRRATTAGPRRGAAVDELWLFRGSDVAELKNKGLRGGSQALGKWSGGPSRWNWGEVLAVLTQRRPA